MRACCFEDSGAADLEPLTLTRPVTELLCGLTSLGEKQRQYFGAETLGLLCRPILAEAVRAEAPDLVVNDPVWLRTAPTVLVNGRWLPPTRPLNRAAPSWHDLYSDGPFLAFCDGDIAYAVLDQPRLLTVSPTIIDNCLNDWRHTVPAREVGGHMIRYPWDLVARNGEQIIRDFEAGFDPSIAGLRPPGLQPIGPLDRLSVDPTARIDPLVVADTTNGPVVIGPGAVVHAFTRLEGPCVIGPGTQVLGASVRAETTIGPGCRIGGEVECSIVHGHTNKYHNGFLGHSYLGEWVNLGAGTQTSDLRNDYQPIDAMRDGRKAPTGMTKVGSFIGDHTRTGLNVLLNCGTTIGAFVTLLPTGQLAPPEVPSFHRHGPGGLKQETDLERLLTTADTVMRRRGKELTPYLEGIYRDLASAYKVGESAVPRLRIRA